MYESPIEVIMGDIQTKIVQDRENQIFQAIQNVGVEVDKAELLKALQYDRDQYQKGYLDARKDFEEKVNNMLKEISADPILYSLVGNMIKEHLGVSEFLNFDAAAKFSKGDEE